MEKKLLKAIELRESGHLQESNDMLTRLVEEYPDDASIHYQCAWNYDLLGEERQAVFFYEKAIELGLSSEELEDALLGLGSTYRTLGEYEKSKQVFLNGLEAYPNNKAIQTFYAMTLYNLNEHSKAMEILLNCLTETTKDPTILSYRKAIDFYSNQLDTLWK
ncbi:tetratricopeptide repeat protein [Bacillus sp. 28A-2]|uniref:tetratricopeptide repeat protein n=1 Tax=Bacillus sp. 28A-2 TaxID=2772252 RepID=UPI00168D85A9|nr:tetratricopeptide repeat protein [Bacillus sp. 28A-2]MBD3859062.1 tetratricopeptide repeat protein [Bacillus sp. 28A-2]